MMSVGKSAASSTDSAIQDSWGLGGHSGQNCVPQGPGLQARLSRSFLSDLKQRFNVFNPGLVCKLELISAVIRNSEQAGATGHFRGRHELVFYNQGIVTTVLTSEQPLSNYRNVLGEVCQMKSLCPEGMTVRSSWGPQGGYLGTWGCFKLRITLCFGHECSPTCPRDLSWPSKAVSILVVTPSGPGILYSSHKEAASVQLPLFKFALWQKALLCSESLPRWEWQWTHVLSASEDDSRVHPTTSPDWSPSPRAADVSGLLSLW